MRKIPLSRGYVALIDNEDFERVSAYRWTAMVQGYKFVLRVYPITWTEVNGKRVAFPLHRFILNFPDGLCVDHIDGDTLDCRRQNLRLATREQNTQNCRKSEIKRTSYFKGVYWRSGSNRSRRWVAAAKQSHKKNHHIGVFKEETDAALAYNLVAEREFGEFAWYNLPLSPAEREQDMKTVQVIE